MTRLRWLAMTLAPPLLYLALIYQALRPPTVVTVTDRGGTRFCTVPM